MAEKKRGANEPEPRPIIVKKIVVDGHGGHHGGAWKVAYADFVTAMMAFFLLMWLLGATTEKQRKGLADYFTPTLVQLKEGSAGSNGMFGGDSMTAKENYPTTGGQGNLAITIPRDASGTKDQGGKATKAADRVKFESIRKELEARMARRQGIRKLLKNIRFTETREGLRIDLIDEADFAMFAMGTDRLLPQARELVNEVAATIRTMPNPLIVRGHTDGLPYSAGQTMNNWMLSSARAEATRKALAASGIGNDRFARIEGVADREPFAKGDVYDPRNRRMSIILGWSRGANDGDADEQPDAETRAAIKERDNPMTMARTEARKLDMGGTSLPAGAQLINPTAPGTSNKPGKH
ncbi:MULTISPECIES: flagellar motor protein MotB [Sphingobium]|uniref:OmpA-like domain-containing protein n=1 Tax=Sphingobium fuliginis (strain ATCC 27551) TaxID=336203 RepID=A0ABQ1ELG9_SPHSA|nr:MULTISPECIES: flagellar motor protein MotB [Sphingobium]AJR22831.1 flagellar motor protein MotB [Sphingobium sp. YBL2]PNQ01587.1 flagellar motor protein MotB [Sphingobium sp. SA916]RYM01193.1 flagellar motor protein MotB [Sphingobium fuliginis]UXC89856.1 OmpA family protein [Sphingobium sp. RSMS]WDA38765.1 flagellar motor protein MotB [Sphingobium sp. YC-XJ3]